MMGNIAIEELFVLAGDAGWQKGTIVIAPVDFRRHDAPLLPADIPAWTAELYADLKREVLALPAP